MPIVHPLIGYNVDEVVDMDNEIVCHIIEWDCSQTSTIDKAIVYCLAQQFIEKNNIKHQWCYVSCTHFHTHLHMDTKQL